MAAQAVEWLVSRKGKCKLVVDGYAFQFSGKGKAPNVLNVRYWICSSSGCTIKARTQGNILSGIVLAHGHVNDVQHVADLKLKVRSHDF